jgi:Fanconi anemia group M protein
MNKKIELIDSFQLRGYQESILSQSLSKNTLVVLPTGLGKTIIALMTTLYYFNKNNKKVIFLAPTKPLVEQQKQSFEQLIKNSDQLTLTVLTGQIPPEKRKTLYQESDIIFATPQIIENDIINRYITPSTIGHIIFDEAHRASKNYAYCFIAEQCHEYAIFLALTASPGTNKEEIYSILKNLYIEHLEYKSYEDDDIKPHVHTTQIHHVEVELSEEQKKIKTYLENAFKSCIEDLQQLGYLKQSISSITKTTLLEFQRELRIEISKQQQEEKVWKAISLSAAALKVMYGSELFESQEFSVAYTYLHNFFRVSGDDSKAAEYLRILIPFRKAYDGLKKLIEQQEQHPKLIKLKELVTNEVKENNQLKFIIFSQYRESAHIIVNELSRISGIHPVLFIGQSKKGETKLSQKEQKKVIEEFREGKYNCLVSTSVGEEGLDIPKVDLVVFYEPVPSAIRSIQRIGRTGRFKQGKAIILQTKDTKDQITRYVASAKEKRMYKVLEQITLEFEKKNKEKTQKTLDSFVKKNNTTQHSTFQSQPESQRPSHSPNHSPSLSLPVVYIDTRENNDLIKELFSLSEFRIEAKQLEVGDIILNEEIGIERKAKIDFVNSIIDKRLFPQLINLARNFKRPVLILEGEENIFSLRNLNPNVIRATLSAISVDLRIPILYTNSIKETSLMIQTMCKRLIKEKKTISLVTDKKSLSEQEELEKVISTIPKINIVTAKELLLHFKTIQNIANATEKEFLEVKGIGALRAKQLEDFFKKEYY